MSEATEPGTDHKATSQAHPANPEQDGFYMLLTALDTGWQIKPPVYLRPRWGSNYAGKQMYHFVLQRGPATTLISVGDSPRLRAFLDEQQIQVDRRS